MRIHGGNPWALARQQGGSPADILDFSVDLNPLGPPDALRHLILQHLDEVRYYPDPDAIALRETLAATHQIPIETILPGNGAAELIGLLTRGRSAANILVVVPTFTEYEWAAEHAGARIVRVVTEASDAFQLSLTPQEWSSQLRGVDLIFLCNPNNPTGTALPASQVLSLARACQEAGAWLVVDEAFIEFTEAPDAFSVLRDAAQQDHLIVLRSLTKLFAIPGLRLGYLVASSSIVETLRARQSAWPLNTLAMVAGEHLLREAGYIARSREATTRFRAELQQQLTEVPFLHPFPSTVNFILCALTAPELTSSALCEQLASQGVLIRNGDGFTGLAAGRFVRIAVRTPSEHAVLLAALQDVMHHAR